MRRLETLSRDAERLNGLIAALERARRAAAAAPGPATITSRDLGKLPWPSDGELLYRFGQYRLPNNTVVLRQGVGIKVPVGTAVHAVAGGVVKMAEPIGTYGPTVAVEHGGAYLTLYLYLSQILVAVGQSVAAGDVLGLSGGQHSDEGPHVEFQVRESGIALDPLNWLRARR